MEKVFATIITIGDELLIGQVIDTNSAWIAQKLNGIGIHVRQRLSVGDVWYDMWQALDAAASQSRVVIITGGLGPTADDITKPLLCSYFGGSMVVNQEVEDHIRTIFTRMGRPLLARNLKQAEVPDVCTVLFNDRGTAPGMWFEKEGVVFASLPGVPHEMKGLMERWVLPMLEEKMELPAIVHRTLLTAGIGESFLAEAIQTWEEALPPHHKLAYLPNYGMVRLRLSAHGANRDLLAREVEDHFATLKSLVAEWLVTDQDEPMERVLGRLLQERGLMMATAESCTGGFMAHMASRLAGSSAWFAGSIVSYANEVKVNLLDVPTDILETYGAVSQPVVTQMVRGALTKTGAQVAVAVSGIMGPDGGSAEKPVGTVWMAAGNLAHIVSKQMHFRFDRSRNIELTALHALNLLRDFVSKQYPLISVAES